MQFFQWTRNPWGQEVLVRISWDLLWLTIVATLLFVALHLFLRRRWIAKTSGHGAARSSSAVGLRERVQRHSAVSRWFHWIMAVAMLVALFTGFLPIVGIQFAWVTMHWIAGLVLLGTILFHIVHASFWQKLGNIFRISGREMKAWWHEMRAAVGRGAPPTVKPGKYPVDHKFYHYAVMVAGLVAIVSGVLMMVRVDTPFWPRNPYLLTDATWGLVYALHGLSGVALVGLTVTHVYFAILPEKRWITLSMIFGWISHGEYTEHFDPNEWTPTVVPDAPRASAEVSKTPAVSQQS